VEPCIDEKTLELHVLGGIRDQDLKESIECHLRECQICLNHFEALTTLYREADEVSDSVVDKLSDLIIEKVGSSPKKRGVLLSPMLNSRRNAPNYLLAADSGVTQRYVNVQSYANVEEDIVARMMKDHESDELVLYLISEERNLFQDCIVEVEGISKRFNPDQNDRIFLPNLNVEDLQGRTIFIKFPLVTFDLTPVSDLPERVLVHGQFQIESDHFDQIQIEVVEEERREFYKIRIMKLKGMPNTQEVDVVVTREGDEALSAHAHQGVAVFEEMDLEKVLKIKIY